MSTPVPTEPDPEIPAAASSSETGNPDPITGEPGAHPVGVGVGALSAGMAGAAIGAVAGPIGILVGATIGALAGGLAGHEVAAAPADPETPVSLDKPLPTASSGLVTPDESSFLGDSTSADSGVTGEAPLVTESALPAFFATSAAPEARSTRTTRSFLKTRSTPVTSTQSRRSAPVLTTNIWAVRKPAPREPTWKIGSPPRARY